MERAEVTLHPRCPAVPPRPVSVDERARRRYPGTRRTHAVWELIPNYIRNLKKWAVHKADTVIEGGEGDYFTGMLLKHSRVKLLESEIVIYPTTQMTRNLLVAKVSFKGQELWLMTSHFESCKENGEERMEQLRLVMKRMREAPDNVNVLFGGDTNLRDTEVAKVGLPSGVLDVWERLGKQEQCRYTWDTKVNTNKHIPQICRFRFDRVYLRPATREGVPHQTPDHMALVGLQKLDCGLGDRQVEVGAG
ncbi:tyrosyl-DNA phosphodiesterase 2-like [Diretmus argenteus]